MKRPLHYMAILFVILFGTTTAISQTIIDGKASLELLDTGIYQISKADGTSRQIDLNSAAQAQVPGILALLFNDCESLRQEVLTKKKYTEKDLKRSVETYNSCSYSDYAPTKNELEKASAFQGDQYSFYGGIGASIHRISFFNLDNYESLTQGQVQLGVAATPGFVGSLQGNLFFTLEISAGTSGDKDFDNAPLPASFKKNSYRLQIGTEVRFLKKSRMQPLIGIGIGAVRDVYKGNYNGDTIDISGGDVFYSPRIGLIFKCNNGNAIGLIASYISEYENDLSFPKADEVVPLIVNNHQINVGINYYF